MPRVACAIPLLLITSMPISAQTPAPPAATSGEDEATEKPARAAARLDIAKMPYPAVVQQAIDTARQVCREAAGTGFVAQPGFIRTGDLTGDGRLDYIMDFREARCAERLTLFSGTGGWDLEIFVARSVGGPVRVFAGRVLDYDLAKRRSRQAMRFQMHGSYCGRVGTSSCFKQHHLDVRPFTFTNR